MGPILTAPEPTRGYKLVKMLSVCVDVYVKKGGTYTYNKFYTVSLKKVPTFELSVTLSNLNRFSKFLHCWKANEICYKIHTT